LGSVPKIDDHRCGSWTQVSKGIWIKRLAMRLRKGGVRDPIEPGRCCFGLGAALRKLMPTLEPPGSGISLAQILSNVAFLNLTQVHAA
jgi:hypothetical protein